MPAHVRPEPGIDDPDTDGKIPPPPDDFLRYDNHWRSGLRQFQSDLEAGRHDPEWQRQAAQAVRERAAGKFDSFKAREYEVFWGQKQKTDPSLRAGESAKVKLETLIEHGFVQVGDVWKYSRLIGSRFGADKQLLIEKETRVVAIDGTSLSFAVPPGQRVFLSNSTELDEIDPKVLQDSEVSLPSSSRSDSLEDEPVEAECTKAGSLASKNNKNEAAQPQSTRTKVSGPAKRGRGRPRKHGAPNQKEEPNEMEASVDRPSRSRGRDHKRKASGLSEEKPAAEHKVTKGWEEPPQKRTHLSDEAVHDSHPNEPVLTGTKEQISVQGSSLEPPQQPPESLEESKELLPNRQETIGSDETATASHVHSGTESVPVRRDDQISAHEPSKQFTQSRPKNAHTSDESVPDSHSNNNSTESTPAGADQQIPAHKTPQQPTDLDQQETIPNDILVRNVRGPGALMNIIHAIDGHVPKPPVHNAWKAMRCYRNNQDMGSLWEMRQAWFVRYMSLA